MLLKIKIALENWLIKMLMKKIRKTNKKIEGVKSTITKSMNLDDEIIKRKFDISISKITAIEEGYKRDKERYEERKKSLLGKIDDIDRERLGSRYYGS